MKEFAVQGIKQPHLCNKHIALSDVCTAAPHMGLNSSMNQGCIMYYDYSVVPGSHQTLVVTEWIDECTIGLWRDG